MRFGAPPLEHFKTVWDALSKGQHATGGIEGIGCKGRVIKLAWCLYETLREADAKFLLKDASTIWLARDGRRQRLLIRFRAVGFVKGEIVSRVGVLGHWKEHDTAATGILDATKAIVRAAVTVGEGRPNGWHDARRACDNHAPSASDDASSVEAAANILFGKIEALTVDAAADETLAGDLMRGRCNLDEEQAVCPNLKLVVRDKTHASRRSLPP